jgi:hypothetical protein
MNGMPQPDTWIIFSSLMVLLFTVLYKRTNIEGFVTDTQLKSETSSLFDIVSKYKTIENEENLEEVSPGLTFYTTSFNTKSYPAFGKAWINVAPKKGTTKDKEKCPLELQGTQLDFEITPIYSRKTGFYLGNNRAVGPYSNTLGIQFHKTFTIILVAKHGNLSEANTELEFLKLYANSPNNNGLSMYVQKNTVVNVNNVQMGKLVFAYGDNAPRQCLVAQADTLMHLDKDVLCFYFIVKDVNSVRILYMTERNANITKLLEFNVANEDITFSNKELVINRLLSWNANIFNVAIYERALLDEDVTSFYNHIMNEYMKNNDPSFMKILAQYNNTIEAYQKVQGCPFDDSTCQKCSAVTTWCNGSQVLMSDKTCKEAVSQFCSANPKNASCECWDKTNSQYNSDACKLYRSIFGTKEPFLGSLSLADIEYVKKKYKLLTLEECPKEIKDVQIAKNKYEDYTYDKLKVSLNTDTPTRKASCPDMKQLESEGKAVDPNLEKILVKKPVDAEDSVIADLYNMDPNIDTDKSKELAAIKKQQIEDMARRESQAHMRIGQVERPATLNDNPNNSPIIQTQSFTLDDQDKKDSFFSRFIKIMVPGKTDSDDSS